MSTQINTFYYKDTNITLTRPNLKEIYTEMNHRSASSIAGDIHCLYSVTNKNGYPYQ